MTKHFVPSTVVLPAAIRVKLNARAQKSITKGINKVIDALRMKALIEENGPTLPAYKKTQNMREALRSIERHLSAIAELSNDNAGGIFEALISRYAHKPGDRETAASFYNDMKRIRAMTRRAIDDKAKLYFTKGEIPARVARDIRKLMIANDLKPTVSTSGLWARLLTLAFRESGHEVTPNMVINALRKGVKIQKEQDENYTK